MSGRFSFCRADEIHKHAHLNFFTCDNPPMVLSFVDARRFGSWHVTDEWGGERGPDPMLEYSTFRRNILTNLKDTAFSKPICEAMLNQRYFNGIGNYLRAEILHRAGRIPPFSRARDVLAQLPLVESAGSKMADILQLCHDVPLEVIHLEQGKDYAGESKESKLMYAFNSWLQCYYNPSMNNMVDHNGRTIWFSGEAGPLAPKNAKSRSKLKSSSKSSGKAMDVKLEPIETDGNTSIELPHIISSDMLHKADVDAVADIPLKGSSESCNKRPHTSVKVDVETKPRSKRVKQNKVKPNGRQGKRDAAEPEDKLVHAKRLKCKRETSSLRRSKRIAKKGN
jgi:endonuclease VIII-like 1